jgi:hypothetical protein
MKSSFDGFFEWMEEDALENGSQGHAFGVSFTGMREKRKHEVCAVWEAFAKPFSRLRVSVSRDRFLHGEPKIHHVGTQRRVC